ncbi:hypothetical protein [Clostridium sp. YIM B02551]|uniref:hypothetical protein n=1 Tax=Clostridium sp. YIM B02551 TaxID=2910679 RepID=UPI001EECB589|nr:hypothetical protein [Clostridium sp. YIM B02551]
MKSVKIIDCFKNKQTLKLSEYFKVINQKYIYIKITPDTSIRNYNSANIAKAIVSLYKPIQARIHKVNKAWEIEDLCKVTFYIYISRNTVQFYFIIPEFAEKLIKEKLSNTWPKATIKRVDSIPLFSEKAIQYEIAYAKEDALSLDINKKCNEPLNSILNVIDILQDDDKVGIIYNLMPWSQKGWKKEFTETIDKIKLNKPLDKEKSSSSYYLKLTIYLAFNILDILLGTFTEFLGGKNTKNKTLSEVAITKIKDLKLSEATIKKKENSIINTQILALSESKDKIREKNNITSICESFKTINEDNELKYKKVKTKYTIEDFKIKKVVSNKMSVDEIQNLFELPGRELLLKHKNIERIDVLEEAVIPELQNGYMLLGEVKYKDIIQNAYLPSDPLYGNLPVTLCGPEGSGKSTLLINKAYESWKAKKACIVIDYIKNNEVCRELIKLIPKEDLIIINCGDHKQIQGLGYNEIVTDSMDPYDILESSSMQTEQDVCLIDSCNPEPLSGRMLKFYLAAANIVHIQPYMNMSNVVECLEDYKKRKEYIDYINKQHEIIRHELSGDIQTLSELDDIGKDGSIIGTKTNSISYIMDRIIKLKSNMQLKHMYYKSCKENINFVQAINDKNIILVMMPQIKFSTPISRNVCATYFISKTWLAAQIRGSNEDKVDPVNIIIDELYQVPIAEQLIGETLEQARKFGNRYIFSCHNFNQLKIAPILKSEGSYIFMHGSDKVNYDVFKNELDPYVYEDMMNLKEFHALNLIKYKNGWNKFISKLPSPIKMS